MNSRLTALASRTFTKQRAVAAGLLLRFFVLSVVMFLAITAICWMIVRKHPKMFQLWGLSWTQKSYYDPRKR